MADMLCADPEAEALRFKAMDGRRLSTSPLRRSVEQDAFHDRLAWMSLRNAEGVESNRLDGEMADTKMRMFLTP